MEGAVVLHSALGGHFDIPSIALGGLAELARP
jgi:hypothetical protein